MRASTSAALALLALLLFALPATPAAAQRPPGIPVHVARCEPRAGPAMVPGYVPGYYPHGPYRWPDVYGYWYYQPPIATNATLAIDFVNITEKVIRSIDFGLLARGQLIAEIRDVGTFSPNVEIKHVFGLDPNVFPIGTALPACVPLRVTYQDGTTWTNPHLPALRRSIYRAR